MAPLAGVRILDTTAHWAGPIATRLLAEFGAQVIKVESAARPDLTRLHGPYPENEPGESHWEEGGAFVEANWNKLGITLDFNKPQGLAIFKQLVMLSDAVVENFTPRVMANFGLDYGALRSLKSDLVMVSATGFGHSGPWTNYLAMGATMAPNTGLSHLTGYRDGEPMNPGTAFNDISTAIHCAFAILAALSHRERTGEGQWIDLSMYEVGVSFNAEAILDFEMNGRVMSRIGNRHPEWAPQGCFRCLNEDEWLALSVRSEVEWRRLCAILGMPRLARDPRFSNVAKRRANHDELDEIIATWMVTMPAKDVMELLQEQGIPSGVVLNNKQSFLNSQLKARRFFTPVTFFKEAERMGTRLYPGLPWKMSGFEPRRRASPRLGQHNGEILEGLLGLSETAVANLRADGVIGTEPWTEETRRLSGLSGSVPLEELLKQGRLASYDTDYKQVLEQQGDSS